MKQLKHLPATVLLSFLFLSSGSSFASAKNSTKEQKDQELLSELTGKSMAKEDDKSLYAEVVGAYQENNDFLFKNNMQAFMKRFKESVYADNVLYLAGMHAVNHSNYPEAIRYFSRVEMEYPHGDKVTSAKFAKAMTYKKMNLPEFARHRLLEIRDRYPGSPESFRADAELKLLK